MNLVLVTTRSANLRVHLHRPPSKGHHINQTPAKFPRPSVAEDDFYNQHLDETPEQRAQRLYAGKGGPLVSWLLDEAHRRQQTYRDMATDLHVTYGYINQLRSGLRSVENISHEFARACALYLGVPTIVIKLVSGSICMSDFAWPSLSEEEVIDRAYRRMASDPSVKPSLPEQHEVLNHAAKKALVRARLGGASSLKPITYGQGTVNDTSPPRG